MLSRMRMGRQAVSVGWRLRDLVGTRRLLNILSWIVGFLAACSRPQGWCGLSASSARHVVLLVAAFGCAGEPDGGGAAPPVMDSDRCVAPAGLGSPQTIEAALDLMNTLPGPVTVSCLVEALDRPLKVYATSGTLSAQPAAGVRSPRIFILSGGLTLSIVPDGRGREVLEFGENRDDARSIKGELHMPVALPISDHEPYEHLRYNEHVTVCGFCHLDEHLVPEVGLPNAYISARFRPAVADYVSLDSVRAEHERCDAGVEPERCAILEAIFGGGPVVQESFPADLTTIFGR